MEQIRKTKEYKEAVSDSGLAKEYAKGLVESILGRCDKYTKRIQQFDCYDLEDAYENGLRKGRELEAEKAMRFAEWTNMKGWTFNYMVERWYNSILKKTALTEELYNSEGFKDYLKQFEK